MNCSEGGAKTCVVANYAILDRDIEINANKDALTSKVEVGDRLFLQYEPVAIKCLQTFRGDKLHEVDTTVGISPFVVVPG